MLSPRYVKELELNVEIEMRDTLGETEKLDA